MDPLRVRLARVGYLLGQAEIGHVRTAFFIDQDIGGLEVAMQQPLVVGEVDGTADCRHHLRPARRQRALGQPLRERVPLHVFHAEIGVAVCLPHFVDGHDRG